MGGHTYGLYFAGTVSEWAAVVIAAKMATVEDDISGGNKRGSTPHTAPIVFSVTTVNTYPFAEFDHRFSNTATMCTTYFFWMQELTLVYIFLPRCRSNRVVSKAKR